MGSINNKEYFVGAYCPDKNIEINGEKLFTPASNTKIVTSWFALNSLGEDYRFHSEYSVVGDTLYIRTRGNPLLGHGDIEALMEDLNIPAKIGLVVLDTGYLNVEPRPPGWCFDDLYEGYAAAVSDVCFELNRIEVKCVGGEIRLEPPNTYFHVRLSSTVKTPRVAGRNVVIPSSRLEAAAHTSFSYPSPPRFLLEYIGQTLRARGLADSTLRLRLGRLHGSPNTFAEKGLGEVLNVLNKNSENIVGELLLLHAGRKLGANGLGETLKALHRQLEEHSIPGGVRIHDGSGLSRYNLVSPKALVKILIQLQDEKVFVDSLPVGSVDGTLKGRLDSRVKAKTGSLLGVRALSGYAVGRVFSIIVNHCLNPEEAVKDIDEFVTQKILG